MSNFVNEFIKQLLSNSLIDIFKPVNEFIKFVFNESILTIYLKYFIVFPIVGLILVKIKSPKGKEGHIIGKILYFIVGYIVTFILDYIAEIIFNDLSKKGGINMNIIKAIISNQVFLTVISGTFVYVLCQIFLEYIINPRIEYKRIKNKISYTLTMYACYYSNPLNLRKNNIEKEIEIYKEASNEMRRVGSELSGYIATILSIKFLKIKKLNDVKRYLIGLSNGFIILNGDVGETIRDNIKYEKKIKRILKIKD